MQILPEHVIPAGEESLIAVVDDLIVFVPELAPNTSDPVKVRLTKVTNSYARATPVSKGQRAKGKGQRGTT